MSQDPTVHAMASIALKAAEIHEKSFDTEASQYKVSLPNAILSVCKEARREDLVTPLQLMFLRWNSTLAWAKSVVEAEPDKPVMSLY